MRTLKRRTFIIDVVDMKKCKECGHDAVDHAKKDNCIIGCMCVLECSVCGADQELCPCKISREDIL